MQFGSWYVREGDDRNAGKDSGGEETVTKCFEEFLPLAIEEPASRGDLD